MLTQVHTDNNIGSRQSRNEYFGTLVEDSLVRFHDHITRIQVHLVDENAQKESRNDKRCMIEVKLKGLEPIAVTNHADTLEAAVSGAIDKVKKSLDHVLSKLKSH